MYHTATGEAIFVIDGHAHGEGSPSEGLRGALAAGDVDMWVSDIAPLRASGLDLVSERLILTALCEADADGRMRWDSEGLAWMRRTWDVRGVAIAAPTRGTLCQLHTPEGFRYLAACERLGVTTIHLFAGALPPAERSAADIEDLDRAAASFPGLNFVVEHGGMPWLEEFCWVATKELNVYAGLGRLMPLIQHKPRYFAEVLSELLFWLGPDRLIFASESADQPMRALVEAFMRFELPADLCAEHRISLSLDVKRQILGENLAGLYGLRVAQLASRVTPSL